MWRGCFTKFLSIFHQIQRVNQKLSSPPGDFGIWLVVYIELITFGLLFIGFAFARRSEVEVFNQSQLLLNQTSGFINTIILLTSSYFVVKAVYSIKNMETKKHKLYFQLLK